MDVQEVHPIEPIASRDAVNERRASRRRERLRVGAAIIVVGLALIPASYVVSAEPLTLLGYGISTDPDDPGDDPWRRSFEHHQLYALPDVTSIRVFPGRDLWEKVIYHNTSRFDIVVTGIETHRTVAVADVSLFLPGGPEGLNDFSTLVPFTPTLVPAAGTHPSVEAPRGSTLAVAIRYRFKDCPRGTTPSKRFLTGHVSSYSASSWQSHDVTFRLWGVPRQQRVELLQAIELIDGGACR